MARSYAALTRPDEDLPAGDDADGVGGDAAVGGRVHVLAVGGGGEG